MKKKTDSQGISPRLLLLAPALVLVAATATSYAGSSSARKSDDSRIFVTAIDGDVDVTMAGKDVSVAPDTTVLLPARIVTGHNGTLGLTQAGTNITVANDTDVEIPAEAVDGNLVARLVQHSGNVFYDVAPRDLGKLRVETPFLVAVIKGTQFNVAVERDRTTISLFEGSLELRLPDDTGVINLDAGEIAIRSLIDDSIRVIGMDDAVALPAPVSPAAYAAADAARSADAQAAVTGVVAAAPPTSNDGAAARAAATVEAVAAVATAPGAKPRDLALSGAFDERPAVARADSPALLNNDVDVGIDLRADDLRGDRGLHLGRDAVVETSVELPGTPAIEVGIANGADLGGAPALELDAGLDASIALDIVVSPDENLVVDTRSLNLALDAAGDVELGVDLGDGDDQGGLDVDLGNDDVDLGLDIDLNLDGNRGSQKPAVPPGRPGGLPVVSPQL